MALVPEQRGGKQLPLSVLPYRVGLIWASSNYPEYLPVDILQFQRANNIVSGLLAFICAV